MQRETPLVSIILPTYNRAHWLAGAIESCLAQTHRQLELIIVDDGSTDGTPQVARAAVGRDDRVRYIRQRNRKLPHALNSGHHAAKGAYLTWSSDDNLYEPNALELMVSHLEANPDAGMVYCDMQKLDGQGNSGGIYRGGTADVLEVRNVVGGCFLYRREVYTTIGPYDPSLFLVEDWDYWFRVRTRYRMDYLPNVAPYLYRWHEGSLTTRRVADEAVQHAKLWCRHVAMPHERSNVLADGYWQAYWRHYNLGNHAAAFRCALICVLVQPRRTRYWRDLVLAPWRCLRLAFAQRHAAE